ncbi:MAG: SET domain-containing protein [Patescibacteria group bacterium]|nr:SET domain-containing protein [Patescibacteria group bacterium]
MSKDIVVKKSKLNKKGVFAIRNFKRGEVVLKWKSKKVLTKEEVDRLPESERHHVSHYTPGEFLLQQKPERFVNHSCDPNTKVGNNCDVAIKDIKKGEEITSDYSVADIQLHFKCDCGSKNCRKYI